MFLCAICVISCTPSSVDTAPFEIVKSDINAYKALNEELAAYDYSFKSNIQIPQTRGKIWNKIRGFLLADAGGFLLGSTFGPIGGLWAAIFGSAVGGPVFAETLYSETNSGNAECPVAVTDSTTTGIVKPPYSATTNSLPSEVEKGNGSDAEAVSYWDIEVHCYNYATDSGYGYLHNRILSDIEMPYIDGMDLAAYIKRYLPEVLIIFITSYLKYAIDAFELSIFRYIPKNSLNVRLPHALRDAINMITLQADQYYTIEMPSRIEKIPYNKILYIQREGKNSVITLTDNSITKVRKSLTQVFKEFKSEDFIYVDRGDIVNLAHIMRIKDSIVELKNGIRLPASHSKLKQIKAKLSDFWEKQI